LIKDSQSILTKWRNYLYQLLNVHRVNDVRQTKIHTAEPLVPEPSDDEIAIQKMKRHKSPGNSQIPSELIKSGCRTTHFEIHKLFNSIWNKEELPVEWKELIIILTSEKGKETECSNHRSMSIYHLHTKYHPTSCCQGKLHMQRTLMGIIHVDLNAMSQLLIIYSAFVKYLRKSGNRMKQCINYL